ncbi:MAG: CotH kinase family protein [Prevotella sp.]|nr:CotH kinase family protein [Prevotella sp.]
MRLSTTHGRQTVVSYACKVRYRGASSLAYDKKSFAVKLLDADGNDLDANIFGIREENSWILDAMAIDRIRMRNRVCFDLWNEVSKTPYETNFDNRNGTKGQFVEVFINGNYHGLYCMTDKIDRKLLGLKKIKVSKTNELTVRGVLYKGNTWGSGSNLLSYDDADTSQDEWNAWEMQYPDDYPCEQTWQPLMDLIDFCSSETTPTAFEQQFNDYFYIDNLSDYAVFIFALHARDTPYKNTFLSTVDLTEGHRYLVTVWDLDTSLGGEWNGDHQEETVTTDRLNYIGPFNRLQQYDLGGWKTLLSEKWETWKTTLFSETALQERMNNYAGLFKTSGAWQREYEKWNNNPVPLCENIDDELAYVYNWYHQNYTALSQQLTPTDPTAISQPRTTTTATTVVYNLNGQPVGPHHHGLTITQGRKYFQR